MDTIVIRYGLQQIGQAQVSKDIEKFVAGLESGELGLAPSFMKYPDGTLKLIEVSIVPSSMIPLQSRMVYIVAENILQARYYALHVLELGHKNWEFVSSHEILRGRNNIKIVVLSGADKHVNFEKIEQEVRWLSAHGHADVEYISGWEPYE